MLNILVVDDFPKLKTDVALQYLKCNSRINFKCEYVTDVNSAKRYIKDNESKIDIVILDLGLPIIQDGDLGALNGLDVLKFMKRYKIKIPVIINSTTAIPDEEAFIKAFKDVGITIKHIASLNGEWLAHFIQFDLANDTN